LVFHVACLVALAGAAFLGCSRGEAAQPSPPPIPAVPDAASPHADAGAEPTTCVPVDVSPGMGTKFCELPGVDTPALVVPPEFCAREFTTTPIIEARVLRFAPNGDLFVAAPSMQTVGGAAGGPGSIVVLPDDDHDGRADAVIDFAGRFLAGNGGCDPLEVDPASLACVHGLAFVGNYVYFTRSNEVRRLPYVQGMRVSTEPSELVAKLGGGTTPPMRWTHTLELGADGTLYVSRGRFDSSECSADERKKGAVLALPLERPLPLTAEIAAEGFRNPMYLRCAPNSCGDCYANELSGDSWDREKGREKLAPFGKKVESWGFPCCVSKGVASPSWQSQDCTYAATEVVAIPLHDTPFGLDFERGVFPAPYQHGIFSALHGVFTSFGGTGVVWMKTDPASLRPTGEIKMFASGFPPRARATDVAFAPDGRMFVGDDTTGKIFWVAPRTLSAPK
jgi:glucose/arabinose dehydrogenase